MTKGITFRDATDQGRDDMFAEVVDLYADRPELGDIYLDGRYVVQVSVEAFIPIAKAFGFEPVVPDRSGGLTAKKTLDLL